MFGCHALQLGHPDFGVLRENHTSLITHVTDDIGPATLIGTFDSTDGDLAESADTTDGEPDTSTSPHQAAPRVICHYDGLPFVSQGIDFVALPHVLRFTDDPYGMLREVTRVLMPEGRLIVTDFNLLGLRDMHQGMRRLGTGPFLPAQSQMIALTRLKDWLRLLGFNIMHSRFGCYRPPNHSDKWLQHTVFMEKVGDRWWLILGAVYMLQAVKRVRTICLVDPAWKMRKSLSPMPASAPAAIPSGSHSTKVPSAAACDDKLGV